MSNETKEPINNKKTITYLLCILLAIVTALVSVVLVLTLLKDPPSFFNANNTSYISDLSMQNFQNGVYIPEAAMTLTEEGANQSVDKIVEATEKIELKNKNKVIVTNYEVNKTGLTKKQVKIPVNYLPQNPELPTGCEITALTTVLNYYGCSVSKTEMADKYLEKSVDRIGNFWEVFVGDPTKNGFGCYAKPITDAANKYLQETGNSLVAKDYSGAAFEDLLSLVESGTPVIIWSTMYDETTGTLGEPYATVKWTIDDKDLQWIAPEHCMVLIGYDLDRNVAIMSDPQHGIVEYDLDTVKARYLALHSQCVVVENMPIISGVQDGATYYTTQCVVVSPRNLDTVTVNGRKQNSNVFLIKGNRNETHRIVVTDINGNTTEIVIYTKDVYSLLDPLEGITELNATANHKDTILSVLNQVQSFDTSYNSSSETQTINDIVKFCNLMLEKIDFAEKELSRLKEEVAKYEGLYLSPVHNNELNKLMEEINAHIACENITNAQKAELVALQTRCKALLDKTTTN